MTLRIFAAPRRYIQGAGALAQLPALVAEFGRRPFVVVDAATSEALRGEIEQQLRAGAESVILALADRRPTAAALEHFAAQARALGADVAVALGGFDAATFAKGVSLALDLPLVAAPTAPACHAPVSRVVDVEAASDAPAETRLLPRPVDLVLVDSIVFAAAPARRFIAGIGDALARKFEIEQGNAAGALNLLAGRPTALAEAAGEAAWHALREHGLAALARRARRECDDALERVVEAMVLLQGIAHESGGPSIAHALARGLAGLPACRGMLHGELVAFALLAQLAFEERPPDLLNDLVTFYRSVGLPARLNEIGIVDNLEATIAAAARRSGEQWLVPARASSLVDAIRRADAVAAKE
jgi:glycerol dehydrogenase